MLFLVTMVKPIIILVSLSFSRLRAWKDLANHKIRNTETPAEHWNTEQRYPYQFVIFNPWKVPWNWIAFYQNSFVIAPGLLYHLIALNTWRLANETFTSNPIVSSKQRLNGLKITNWYNQFVIVNPWNTPLNWIAFSQNFFVICHGLLYNLARRNTWHLANEAFRWNPIVSSK